MSTRTDNMITIIAFSHFLYISTSSIDLHKIAPVHYVDASWVKYDVTDVFSLAPCGHF